MKYRYYIIQKMNTCIHIYVYMYIHKTEEHCLSHLIYVQHIQWMSKTGYFQHPSMLGDSSCAMLLELLAVDCSLILTKG